MVAASEGVGKNLMDHPSLYLTWAARKGSAISLADALSPANIVKYAANRDGEMTWILGS